MTYGSAFYSHDKKAWVIQCEPHVALKLKRIFTGQGKHSRDKYFITDNLENARNLHWFFDRYPMENRDAKLLESRAQEHRQQTEAVAGLLAKHIPPNEFELAEPAREYQKIAATLLLTRGSLLLADQVGLGKTLSAICTFLDPRTLPALVVTLTHLPRQWRDEINRFAPGLSVHIINKGKPYDLMDRRTNRTGGKLHFGGSLPDVIIINYHKLSGWAETLAKTIGVNSITYDEVQELRRRDSDKYKSARYLADKVQFRHGLSATPIFNYGDEMFAVMDCLEPGGLGTHEEFVTEWCGGYPLKIREPKAFGLYLRDTGAMLLRTRQDVGREIPAVSNIKHYVDADMQALETVSRSCAELATQIVAGRQSRPGEMMHMSEQLSNELRQATGIAKAPYCAEFIKLLLESEEKIVVYAWHRSVYDVLNDLLAEYKPAMFTGSETAYQKDFAKLRFTSGDARILLISLRAGAGLDGLQKACRTVVFAELDWSPGVHEQCVGRVARDGQPDPVAAYFLVSDHGADPVMSEVLGLKEQQSDAIRDPNKNLVESLQASPDRIKKLAISYLQQRGIKAEKITESVA